jgi:hypothetical protein
MSNGRCYQHGGASLVGAASATAKTLEHSQFLPARMKKRYEESLEDPQLLTLKREVAVIRTRLTELLQRVDERGLGRDTAVQLDKAYKDLRVGMAAQDKAMTERAFLELGGLIQEAQQDYAIWNTINQQIGLLERTTAAERKRLVEAEYVVKVEEVMNFVGAVVGIIQDTVKDRQQITIIQNRVNKMLEADYKEK